MTVAPQADQEIVVGTIVGVITEGVGKYIVQVQPDGSTSQYPRRLRTGEEAQAQQLSGLVGQRLSFMCRISHYQRQDGSPGKSSWINGFGQPGQMVQSPQPQPVQPMQPVPVIPVTPTVQSLPAPQPVTVPPAVILPPAPATLMPMEREERIMREAAAGVAVQLLKHLKPEDQTFDNLIRMSERLVGYYRDGVAWPTDDVNEDPGPQGIPHDDGQFPQGY